MKTFECYFVGRQVGAIGKFSDFIVTVEAESEEAAKLKLYDTHEHISKLYIKYNPPGLAPRLPRNAPTAWGYEKYPECYDSRIYDTEAMAIDAKHGNFSPGDLENYRHENVVQASLINGQFEQARQQCARFGLNYDEERSKL